MGQFLLGESQSRIYPHMRAKFGRGRRLCRKKKGWSTDKQIMKLLQTCRYNTANNVSNCGGDPATQLIVNVYQMIKL